MERLRLKGALEEKKLKSQELAARAAGVIRGLRDLAVPAVITPLQAIHTEEIRELASLLHEIKTQYLEILFEMDMIKGELS